MLQEMGLDRDKCTEYMDAAGIYGSDIDDIRLTPNFLHHHVQSSELYRFGRVWAILFGSTVFKWKRREERERIYFHGWLAHPPMRQPIYDILTCITYICKII